MPFAEGEGTRTLSIGASFPEVNAHVYAIKEYRAALPWPFFWNCRLQGTVLVRGRRKDVALQCFDNTEWLCTYLPLDAEMANL